MNQNDYISAGFRVMSLEEIKPNGQCGCGNPKCKAVGKHPRAKNWQNTPDWSDEQLENMEMYGQFKTGFGVLVDNHLVIDVDPRNGGWEGYAKLKKDLNIDFEKESGFVVKTGGDGLHIYFNRPADSAVVSKLDRYKGVDFKSSGFVVGCGSMHKSGTPYEDKDGHPEDLTDTPVSLLELLKKPERYRANIDGGHIDVSDNEIKEMLNFYPNNDLDYEDWIRVGMGIHDATSGTGFDLWVEWSEKSSKFDFSDMKIKWKSFGESANPTTIGTIIYHAEENGYKQPITFNTDLDYTPPGNEYAVDLRRPPGFVGKLTEWINSQSRAPRENIAVGAALSAIGNIAGLRYLDDDYGTTSNIFIFSVSGSGTGKEAIQQAQFDIQKAAGMAPATHGFMKSEQEVIRNLIRHQPALYIVDEVGIFLSKIDGAKKSGTAYLSSLPGVLMSVYSKANSSCLLNGDLTEQVKQDLAKEVTKLRKKEDHDGEDFSVQIKEIEKRMFSIDDGLENPFLSINGFTTPETFDGFVTLDQITNGFFARSFIIKEKETNPKSKKRHKAPLMDDQLKMTLSRICNGGHAEIKGCRIERRGDFVKIKTTDEAKELLDKMDDDYWEDAERSKEQLLEAIPRRGLELVLKISFILAIPEGIRTLEHVQWGKAFVDRDLDGKINLARENMAEDSKNSTEQLKRKIIGMLDDKESETTGVIANRCEKIAKKEDTQKILEELEGAGVLMSKPARNKGSKKWFLACKDASIH